MYQVTPYDVKQSFKLVPKNERYKITFAQGSSISFNSKRDAFNFISAISNFFSEILQVSEMIHATINQYRYQISPKRKSNDDPYNIFYNNDLEINILIRDLKYYQKNAIEMYQLASKFDNLIYYLRKNAKILFAKLPTAVAHIVILIDKINLSFTNVIANVESHYRKNNLTLFNI